MNKIKVEEPGRRPRRGRDDAGHLAADQGEADLPLSRPAAALFRPVDRESRSHRRPGHHRRGPSHPGLRRRREMRDHHARRGAGEGVRPQEDVEVAERHHPQHPRRRHLPRADHLQQRAAARAGLDQADRHRPPRLRRRLPRHRFPRARQGQAHHRLRGRGRHAHRACGARVRAARASRSACSISTTRSATSRAPRFNYALHREYAGLSLDQEHHPQGL